MQTTRFTLLSGLVLAVLLTLLVGQGLVFGQDDGDRLAGTWNVTLRFPLSSCTAPCTCPGGMPNIPIPGLHMYLKDGSYLAASGGSLFSGPQLGSWEGIGHHQFEARYKFFRFNSDGSGSRSSSEEVTNHITLTGTDTFSATATVDLFDASGTPVATGCIINETATRFE